MEKPACRGLMVDKDLVHCSQPHRLEGAETVFVNGIPWSCQGHRNHPHLRPGGDFCDIHQAPIAMGSPTVIVEGRGAGRIGDKVAACTVVITGSPDVFCGP